LEERRIELSELQVSRCGEGTGGVYVDFLDLRMFGDAGTISLDSGDIF
jgi:hypothetical protein